MTAFVAVTVLFLAAVALYFIVIGCGVLLYFIGCVYVGTVNPTVHTTDPFIGLPEVPLWDQQKQYQDPLPEPLADQRTVTCPQDPPCSELAH